MKENANVFLVFPNKPSSNYIFILNLIPGFNGLAKGVWLQDETLIT